ncbi:hypothetical protein L9F63_014045, partial [Diploptera punctata]
CSMADCVERPTWGRGCDMRDMSQVCIQQGSAKVHLGEGYPDGACGSPWPICKECKGLPGLYVRCATCPQCCSNSSGECTAHVHRPRGRRDKAMENLTKAELAMKARYDRRRKVATKVSKVLGNDWYQQKDYDSDGNEADGRGLAAIFQQHECRKLPTSILRCS